MTASRSGSSGARGGRGRPAFPAPIHGAVFFGPAPPGLAGGIRRLGRRVVAGSAGAPDGPGREDRAAAPGRGGPSRASGERWGERSAAALGAEGEEREAQRNHGPPRTAAPAGPARGDRLARDRRAQQGGGRTGATRSPRPSGDAAR